MREALEHTQKFWAFVALLTAFLLTLFMGSYAESEEVVQMINTAIGGLGTAVGTAALALFRHSQTEQDNAASLRNATEKVPPVTGEAREAVVEDGVLPPQDRINA